MIRTVDFKFDKNIKYTDQPLGIEDPESELKASLRFLDKAGSVFYNIGKGAALVDKVSHLKPLSPIAGAVGQLMEGLGRVSQIANIFISTEAFIALTQEGKIGLNLASAKETLIIIEKGVELASWFSEVEKLGSTFRILSNISSISLGIALLSPMLDLLMHLRAEGWNALKGPECYKTSYRLGLSLLAVYLFMSALTMSTYLNIAIQGVDFALSYL